MLKGMLCRAVCIAGLAGTLGLLAGCENSVDKSGAPTAPQNMDAQKQKQYEDFMKGRGGKPGGGGPSGAPGAKPVAPPPHG
jgi:hypothetical protein